MGNGDWGDDLREALETVSLTDAAGRFEAMWTQAELIGVELRAAARTVEAATA